MKEYLADSRRKCFVRSITVGIVLILVVSFVWRIMPTGNAKVEVVFSHFERVNGIDLAVVQVSNSGNEPVVFYGYGWQAPFYWIATAKGTNWAKETNWSFDYSPGFDHSKTRPISLPPGAK